MTLRRPLILIRSASVLATLAIFGCQALPPKIDISIYAGDSKTQSVKRNEQDVIKASDPRFDQGVWISYSDLKKVFDVIQACQEWPRDYRPMDAHEAVKAVHLKTFVEEKSKGNSAELPE